MEPVTQPQSLRTRLAVRMLLAGFSLGGFGIVSAQSPAKAGAVRAAGPDDSVVVVRAAMPDDSGYEQYRSGGTNPQSGSTVGRAWNNVKKWVDDRGTNFSKSFSDSGNGDASLMPLTPAAMPQFANGSNAQPQPTPNAANPQRTVPPPYAKHPQAPFGGAPVMAGPQGAGIAPQQLAGKPAFNWYGWGSAPASGYPQASPNWMNQTGATPGAFPVTGQQINRMPQPQYPPVNIGGPRAVSTIPTIPSPTIAPPLAEPKQTLPTIPTMTVIPTITPAPQIYTPVYTAPVSAPATNPKSDDSEWQPATRIPRIELQSGKAESGRIVPAVSYDPVDSEPSWQTAKISTPKLLPVPLMAVQTVSASPATLPVPIPEIEMTPVVEVVNTPVPKFLPVPATMARQPASWQPSPQPVPPLQVNVAAPPITPQTVWHQPTPSPQQKPTPPTGRSASRTNGQPVSIPNSSAAITRPLEAPVPHEITVKASRQILELERQIRTATIKTATILEVNELGPQKIAVKYVAKTESAAREAAQIISALPSVLPFAVDFEVRLVER